MEDSVPRVIPTLAPNNDVSLRCKHVDNLALYLRRPTALQLKLYWPLQSEMGKNFPDASGRTQSGLPTNNRLANAGRNTFRVCAHSLLLVQSQHRREEHEQAALQATVFASGCRRLPFWQRRVQLGARLPDSINVGRTTPVASGFAVRELGRRDVLRLFRASFLLCRPGSFRDSWAWRWGSLGI
mgnify:CR=1 FL=1